MIAIDFQMATIIIVIAVAIISAAKKSHFAPMITLELREVTQFVVLEL